MANTSLADFIKRIQNSRDTAFSTAAGNIANAQLDFSDPMMTSAALSSRDTQQQLINTNNAINEKQKRFAGYLSYLGQQGNKRLAEAFTPEEKPPRDRPKYKTHIPEPYDPEGKLLKGLSDRIKELEGKSNPPTGQGGDPASPTSTPEGEPQEISLYNKSGVRPAGNFQGQVIQSGYTGASEFIGGSTGYHIDQKFRSGTPMNELVDAVDQLAAQYRRDGRIIEFSNQGGGYDVSGKRWDPKQPYEVKAGLLKNAMNAHTHSITPNMDSVDYFAVKEGAKNRFVPNSVEKAKIYTFVPEGYTARPGMGGGYGLFTDIINPANKQIWGRTGHGHTGMERFAKPSITDYGGGAM